MFKDSPPRKIKDIHEYHELLFNKMPLTQNEVIEKYAKYCFDKLKFNPWLCNENKELYFEKLKNINITNEEFQHEQEVWDYFNLKSFIEYCELRRDVNGFKTLNEHYLIEMYNSDICI